MDYSKWENIELSDDEDVEVHPNVDRDSFIRWRREAIHIKRKEQKEAREQKIQEIEYLKLQRKQVEELGLTEDIKEIDARLGPLEASLKEELEQEKKNPKWTSENINREVYDKTVINSSAGTKKEKEKLSVSDRVIEELSNLESIDDSQLFISRHPEVIGNKAVFDGLFKYIFNSIQANDRKKARAVVSQYLLLQYCESAQEGSGIYWVFKRLSDKKGEQRIQFEKDVEERLKVLENQFSLKIRDVMQPTSKIEEIVEEEDQDPLSKLSLQIRQAIREGDEAKLNTLLRGLELEQIEKILVSCKEAEMKEFEKIPNNPEKPEEKKEIRESIQVLYDDIIKKIVLFRNFPDNVRLALQTQNTASFVEGLKELPYPQASDILDQCVNARILRLEKSGLESLKTGLKANWEQKQKKSEKGAEEEELNGKEENTTEAQDPKGLSSNQEAITQKEKEKKKKKEESGTCLLC